jgi:predicted nucleotidyltransferase
METEKEKRDISIIRSFLKSKSKRKKERLAALHSAAVSDFNRIVWCLIHDFTPKRIYQWGSLIESDRFSEISDIDIAVEGWKDPETALKAGAAIEKLTAFPVDLVELERIHPAHAESIRRKGKIVYEKA